MLPTTFLAPIAFAATVLADGAAINGALKTVDNNIKALTSSLKSFNGNIFATLPILGASTKLNKSIQSATSITNDSEPLTSDETLALADTTNIIITDAKASIDAVIEVKPKFDKLYIVSPITVGLIKELKKSTGQLGDAIIAKVPQDFKEVAAELIGEINKQFDRGLEAYATDSGSGGFPGFPGSPTGLARSANMARSIEEFMAM
jgi:hypothetical protein